MGKDGAQRAVLRVGRGDVVDRPVRVPALNHNLRSQAFRSGEERVLLDSDRCRLSGNWGPGSARFIDRVDALDHFPGAERAFFIVQPLPAPSEAVTSNFTR